MNIFERGLVISAEKDNFIWLKVVINWSLLSVCIIYALFFQDEVLSLLDNSKQKNFKIITNWIPKSIHNLLLSLSTLELIEYSNFTDHILILISQSIRTTTIIPDGKFGENAFWYLVLQPPVWIFLVIYHFNIQQKNFLSHSSG